MVTVISFFHIYCLKHVGEKTTKILKFFSSIPVPIFSKCNAHVCFFSAEQRRHLKAVKLNTEEINPQGVFNYKMEFHSSLPNLLLGLFPYIFISIVSCEENAFCCYLFIFMGRSNSWIKLTTSHFPGSHLYH